MRGKVRASHPCGSSGGRWLLRVQLERGLDPAEGRILLTVDALGVHLQQDVDAVSGPFGYLARERPR